MSRVDEARYGRACLLVLNVCPFTLRHVIDDYSIRHGSLSLFDFLEKKKHSLFHLVSKKCCCTSRPNRVTPMYKSQWESLYIRNTSPCTRGATSDCPCQYNARPGITTKVMDVTMCVLVITNICPGVNVSDVNTIREIRNKLIHANSGHLDQVTFRDYWNKVKSSLLNLASQVSPTVQTDTLSMINELDARIMNPDELGELRKIIMDEKRIKDLEENVSNITDNLEQTKEDTTHLEKKVAGEIARLEETLDDHGRQLQTQEKMIKSRKAILKIPNIIKRLFRARDTEVKDLQEKLCKLYSYETQKVPISPLQKTSKMPLEEIFVPICIREDLEYQGKGKNIGMKNKRTKPVNCPDDMFYIDGDMARNVFMLGDAGIGKSVFCLRLLENWCKAKKHSVGYTRSRKRYDSSRFWVNGLRKFDFLFFVQLRHVDKSRSSVIDMIVSDVFQSHPSCHDVIRQVLFSEKYACLIVIDGVDEWKISKKVRSELKIEGLPNTENMTNCTFLWSMRPWVMDKLSDMIRGNDRVVEIQGLDADSIDIVIEKMLVNFYELDKKSLMYKEKEKYIFEKSNEGSLKSIMQIPLMAIACIQIWYEEKQVGNSMTSLYVALIDLLIRRYKQKESLSADCKDEFTNESLKYLNIPQALQEKNMKEFIPVIMKLGQIAYNDLISDDTHLVFREEDLEDVLEKKELDAVLKIGLLSKCEAPGSCNEENVSLNFFHKSMQEFLAAIYIEIHGEVQTFFRHLSSVDVIMELGNVLIFLSGLNPMLGSSISKHIVDIANCEKEICKFRRDSPLFNALNDRVKSLYKLQVSCVRDIAYTHSSTDYTQHIPYHLSDVFVNDDSDIQTIRTTVDILTHHNADIRSLFLYEIPTDIRNGIPDSVLTQYLDNTLSLQSLWLHGYNTNRTLHHISDIFSSLTALVLWSITLSSDSISTLQSALQSNTVIQTLGLVGIECHVNKENDPVPASLSGIIQILPDLKCLSSLYIQVTNDDDKSVLRDTLSRLSHLHSILYCGTYSDDDEYDRDVVQALCTWSGLRWLWLCGVDLGDSGLQLSHDMSRLDEVIIDEVKMSPSGWRYFLQSVLNIHHEFNIHLLNIHIDEEFKKKIRSSPQLEITGDEDNEDGSYDIDCKRLWQCYYYLVLEEK